jgi:hypothetical protein
MLHAPIGWVNDPIGLAEVTFGTRPGHNTPMGYLPQELNKLFHLAFPQMGMLIGAAHLYGYHPLHIHDCSGWNQTRAV